MKINKLNNKKLYILASFGLIAFVLLLFNIIITPVYETRDDTIMALILEGGYGKSNGFIFFQNILYCKFQIWLYDILPSVKWYTVLQLIAMYVSLYSIMYVLFKRLKFVNGLLANLFLSVFVGYYFLHIFQFTRTTALCSIAGLIVLFDSFCSNNKKNQILKIILGMLLLDYAAMLRFFTIEMIAGMLCVVGILRIVEIIKKKEKVGKKIGLYVLVFAIALAVPYGINQINVQYYNNEENSYYTQYNSARSNLYDFGWLNYESNQEIYDSLGISKEDNEYFSTWNVDTDVLTLDAENSLVAEKTRTQDLIHSIIDAVLTALYGVVKDYMFWMFVAFGILLIIFNHKKWWVVLFEFALFGMMQSYLVFIGRFGVPRIDICFYTAGMISFLYLLDVKPATKKSIIRNICLLLVSITSFSTMVSLNPQKESFNEDAKEMYDTFSEDKEHIYFYSFPINGSTILYVSQAFKFFERVPENYALNIHCLGGFWVETPLEYQSLSEYGIENPYRDSINNEKVYFVTGSNGQVIISYIQRHYDENAKLEKVDEINGQNVFKVVT